MPTLAERLEQHRSQLLRHGQEHVLAYWPKLDAQQQAQLLDDLDQVDLPRCAPLIERYVLQRPTLHVSGKIAPAEALPSTPEAERAALYQRARVQGEALLRDGAVAAFTVAGGQGTRLGYDGPKGAYPISPIRNASLFQLFAEYLRGAGRRYGRVPRWYIMTSPSNHAQTIALFERAAYFGLAADQIFFFPQRQMPTFTHDGKIGLSEPHRLALSPDGHGGSLHALRVSGALQDMQRRGIDYISYFQVDNPLVRCVDPLFLGLHALCGSQMSSKAVTKRDARERVGVFARVDGALHVIEYSDLPQELSSARQADGSLQYYAGSIAIHALDRAFVEQLTAPGAAASLPWHRADKQVPLLERGGQRSNPSAPNAVKLELFVFDAIPLARNPLVLMTPREEEFSPVKNAEGEDSPATTRRDLVRRAARWLAHAGVQLPLDAHGAPAAALEISPALALDEVDLREQLARRPLSNLVGPLLLAP